jgi:phosphoribosylformylglycinamidine cyclo-ligase
VHAIAHITGGGVIDNVPRVLPDGLAATIERSTWTVPSIFEALQRAGGIHLEEMWRTFNMGVGMVVVVAGDSPPVELAAGIPVWRIGEVVPQTGTRRVLLR